jgi:hypothetical protein
MGTELDPDTSGELQHLTRLSDRENFIELQLSLRDRMGETCWNSAVSLQTNWQTPRHWSYPYSSQLFTAVGRSLSKIPGGLCRTSPTSIFLPIYAFRKTVIIIVTSGKSI